MKVRAPRRGGDPHNGEDDCGDGRVDVCQKKIGEEAAREVLPGKGGAVHQRERPHPQRAQIDARRHQHTSHIVSKYGY